MKFILSSLFFAGLACARVAFTNSDFSGIEAGTPFEITWSNATGPVTITLKSGPSDDLSDVSQITSGQTGESFSWVPSTRLDPSTNYALEISDGTDINYSVQFFVEGGAAASSSSSATSSATSTSTSAVSSSTVSTVSSSTASSTTASSTSATSSTESASSTSSATSTSSVTSSASITRSVTSAIRTPTSEPEETSVPGTNGAQGVMAPLAVPLLMAIGAALF